MNQNTAKELLPIIQALAEGKTIQSNIHGEWRNVTDPTFLFAPEHYRIKPEEPRKPRQWVLRPHTLGCGYVVHSGPGPVPGECVRVREVIEP